MEGNLFAQLQAINSLEAETTVLQIRKQLNALVEWFKSREEYLKEVTIMAKGVRNLEIKTLLDCDSFMVQDSFYLPDLPEEFQHDSLGFCKGDRLVFRGRYIYPVKDVRGDVMGFCGYDKFDANKYLDSQNYGYRAKTFSCWGMEKLPEYYKSNRTVFFVEGIVCALYIRQCGMQSLAMLGSLPSTYVVEIMKRFGSRCIIICDSDEAGTKCRKSLRYRAPMARCLQSTLAKDIDDSRKVTDDFANELRKLETNIYYPVKLLR